jgi:DNA repair exonuclease SbcCD ATPase subunit
MIVRSLVIRNWRGVLGELRLELAEGLNVVTGPNEVGKSSVAEALYHGLLTPHSSDTRESRLWIPKGRGLAPSVELELACGAAEYRVEKSFGPQAAARLYRLEGGRWALLAERRQVQEILDRMLAEGGVREYATGLWYLQGMSHGWGLAKLDGAARDRIHNALAGMLFRPEDEAVERLAKEEFRRRLQPKRLDPAKQGPLHEALGRWQDARRKREECEQRQADYEGSARQLANLHAEHARLADQERRCRERFERLGAERERWTEYDALERETRLACNRVEQLQQALERWEEAIRDLHNALIQLENNRAAAAEQQQVVLAADAALASASARAEALRERRDALAAATEYVLALLAAREARRAEKVRAMASSAPSRDEMDALRELKREADVLRARAEQASLRMRLQPAAELSGRITRDGESEQPFRVAPDAEQEWSFARRLRVDIDGVGTLSVEAGSEDAEQAHRRWCGKARALARRMAAWVTVDERADADALEAAWKELEKRYRDAESSRKQADELERGMTRRFGYGPDEAAARLEEARDRLPADRSLLQEAPDVPWTELESIATEELAALEVSLRARQDAIEEDLRAADTEVTRCQQDRAAAQQELQRLQGVVAGLQQAAGAARHQLGRARARAAEALGLDDPGPVPEDGWSADGERNLPLYRGLLEALGEAKAKAQELEGHLRAVRPEGERVGDSNVQAAKEELERVQRDIRTCEADIHRLEGELRQLGDGLWEELQRARAEEEEARAVLERECLHARALHLLRVVLEEERGRLLDKVLDPVREWVEPRLAQITSNRYREVMFDRETLRPTKLRADGTPEWLSYDGELSQGTSEQVAFLTRLGLASLLATNDRQLVVFDDPLVNTDPERQALAWQVLLEAAQRLQVLYLTCHPLPPEVEGQARVISLSPPTEHAEPDSRPPQPRSGSARRSTTSGTAQTPLWPESGSSRRRKSRR